MIIYKHLVPIYIKWQKMINTHLYNEFMNMIPIQKLIILLNQIIFMIIIYILEQYLMR